LKRPFNRRAEIWEPFKMELIRGLQSWTLLGRICTWTRSYRYYQIKNQPSYSTSCNDNTLHLLVLVTGIFYWGLQVTQFGVVLSFKGCFERGKLYPIAFEGHRRLQSWTLASVLGLAHMNGDLGLGCHGLHGPWVVTSPHLTSPHLG
jgi:hypothetical protein